MFLKEFRDFAIRGNMIDMAIGVIIGGGFAKIVTSLVNDILMPPIGLLLGRVDFTNLFIDLSGKGYTSLEAAKAAGAPTVNYGLFLNTLMDFLIVALVVFWLIGVMNRLRKPAPAPEPATKTCPYCAMDIPLKATRCPNCTSAL
jgi:large conductance mechanosensitive channel